MGDIQNCINMVEFCIRSSIISVIDESFDKEKLHVLEKGGGADARL